MSLPNPTFSSDVSTPVEVVEKCPACGQGGALEWCRSCDRQFGGDQVFVYSQCSRCNSLFQSQRPIETAIGRFYPAQYAPHHGSKTTAVPYSSNLWVGRFNSLGVRLLNRVWPHPVRFAFKQTYTPLKKGARLLDFGCGSDRFLNEARARGWKTVGVDFTESALQTVRESGHESHIVGPQLWGALGEQCFDCVRLNHVLEHLYYPIETLSQLRRVMNPGARLHIAVPNPNSLSARFFRQDWYSLEAPRHIVLFSAQALALRLQEIGFSAVRVVFEATRRDWVRSQAYRRETIGHLTAEQARQISQNPQEPPNWQLAVEIATRLRIGGRFHVLAEAGEKA